MSTRTLPILTSGMAISYEIVPVGVHSAGRMPCVEYKIALYNKALHRHLFATRLEAQKAYAALVNAKTRKVGEKYLATRDEMLDAIGE